MLTPKTNKLLIYISILIVMIFAFLFILNYDFLIKKVGFRTAKINEATNRDDTLEKHYTKQDSIQVDLKKLRNDTIQLPDEIIKMVTSELKDYNWNEEFQEEDLYSLFHETVYAKQFPLDPKPSKSLIVTIFSNHSGNLCHAARGRISLFEFQRQNQSWQMTRKYLAFGYGTEYGLEPLWCNLIHIGNNNKYAVIVQTDYSGNGGHEVETQSIYSEVGCSFELVFDFTNYEHYEDYPKDIEYTEGYSNMRFVKSGKAWFDIETKSEETAWNDKTTGAVKHYTFNGKEYVEAIQHLN